jgi:hypothetical protein
MTGNDIPLKDKLFYSHQEFGGLIGVSKITVYSWVRKGYLRAARFSPRCVMIPKAQQDANIAVEPCKAWAEDRRGERNDQP